MTLPLEPLADLASVFSEPILYKIGGAGPGISISAIFSDSTGEAFQGPGQTVRQCRFEIAYAALAQAPRVNDIIERPSTPPEFWRVIDRVDRGDVRAWIVSVETV